MSIGRRHGNLSIHDLDRFHSDGELLLGESLYFTYVAEKPILRAFDFSVFLNRIFAVCVGLRALATSRLYEQGRKSFLWLQSCSRRCLTHSKLSICPPKPTRGGEKLHVHAYVWQINPQLLIRGFLFRVLILEMPKSH